ncbi:MAG: DUF2007 domain-containing protein [Verrucomicrobiota bacterium]
MDFATVFKTFNSAEANLVAAQLESAGFEPTVLNELSSLTLGSAITAGSIRVQVPESQSADARALIESTVNAQPASEADESSPSDL